MGITFLGAECKSFSRSIMGTVTPDKLPQFTGKIGNGPGFSEFLVRLTVILREKDLHSATRNVIPENAENIFRPIPTG